MASASPKSHTSVCSIHGASESKTKEVAIGDRHVLGHVHTGVPTLGREEIMGALYGRCVGWEEQDGPQCQYRCSGGHKGRGTREYSKPVDLSGSDLLEAEGRVSASPRNYPSVGLRLGTSEVIYRERVRTFELGAKNVRKRETDIAAAHVLAAGCWRLMVTSRRRQQHQQQGGPT